MVAVGLFAFLLKRDWFVYILAVAASLPATAAVSTSTTSVAPFFVLAILATGLAVLAVLAGEGGMENRRAWRALVQFAVVALAVTAFAPAFFPDIRILSPRSGIDSALVAPMPLDYTPSMLAQAAYLVLGLGTAAYLAQQRSRPNVLEWAFVSGIVTSTAALVAGDRWPQAAFRDFQGAAYNDFDQRHAGVFPEPSVLSVFGIAAATYYLLEFRCTKGRRRYGSGVMFLLSLVNLLMAGSGTAAASLLIVGALLVTVYFGAMIFAGRRVHPLAPVVIPALVLLGLEPRVRSLLSDVIADKLASQSATNRFAADGFSFEIAQDTFGIGVGLGANRPSSFALMLLSTVGVVGLTLFAVASFRLIWPAISQSPATTWSMTALLIAKSVADPNLSTPLLWLSAGVLLAVPSGGARRARHVDPDRAGRDALMRGVTSGLNHKRKAAPNPDSQRTVFIARPKISVNSAFTNLQPRLGGGRRSRGYLL